MSYTMTIDEDGTKNFCGELPTTVRRVLMQHQEEDGDWHEGKPGCRGPFVPTDRNTALGLLNGEGPFKYKAYRLVPVREVDSPEKAERIARLKALPKREHHEKKETELVSLIRSNAIAVPLAIEGLYKGETIVGRILDNGTVELLKDGSIHKSLSAAAAAAKATIAGKLHSTDGWSFFQQRVNGKLKALPRAK